MSIGAGRYQVLGSVARLTSLSHYRLSCLKVFRLCFDKTCAIIIRPGKKLGSKVFRSNKLEAGL